MDFSFHFSCVFLGSQKSLIKNYIRTYKAFNTLSQHCGHKAEDYYKFILSIIWHYSFDYETKFLVWKVSFVNEASKKLFKAFFVCLSPFHRLKIHKLMTEISCFIVCLSAILFQSWSVSFWENVFMQWLRPRTSLCSRNNVKHRNFTVSRCEKFPKQRSSNIKFQVFLISTSSRTETKWRHFHRWLGAQRIRQLMMKRSSINCILTNSREILLLSKFPSETINISIPFERNKKNRKSKLWKC